VDISFLIGALLVIGAVAAIASKLSASGAFRRGQLEAQAELATLQERLAGKDIQISKLESVQKENTTLREQLSSLNAILEQERKQTAEKMSLIEKAQTELSNAFKALSSDALKSNNQTFLELAKTTLEKFQEGAKGDLESRQKAINEMVEPVKEKLKGVETILQSFEKNRTSAETSLTEQIKYLASQNSLIQKEAHNLSKALRAPTVRGRWGEIQLRRVVEMAGMIEYCDFMEQQTVTTDQGRALRPDLVIRLPNNKIVVVDSKAPLQAYLEAMESQNDDERAQKLREHAQHVRSHLSQLSQKSYWSQFDQTPEFAVLFLPGESFYSAALQNDPSLIEFGVGQSVIPATPTTLIALLRAVAYGWRQEQLEKNAQQISALGKELHERLSIFAEHFASVGTSLDRSVEAYNRAVSSLEQRVLVTGRRFKELGAGSSKDIEVVNLIDKSSRNLQATELLTAATPALISTEKIESDVE